MVAGVGRQTAVQEVQILLHVGLHQGCRAQASAAVRHQHRRTNSVATNVSNADQKPTIRHGNKVKEVAADLLSWTANTGDIVSRDPRLTFGKQSLLDSAR